LSGKKGNIAIKFPTFGLCRPLKRQHSQGVGSTNMKAFKLIENYEVVIDAFGYWPSFHDAEIHWLKLERLTESYQGYFCPNIEFAIHCWEMTSETTEDGYFKLQKLHLVHFKFEDIYDMELDGFNHQNALLGLNISAEQIAETGNIPIKIELDPAYGLGGEFKAHKGTISGISPCCKNGKMSQRIRIDCVSAADYNLIL
jgi:hypothetical protein